MVKRPRVKRVVMVVVAVAGDSGFHVGQRGQAVVFLDETRSSCACNGVHVLSVLLFEKAFKVSRERK